MNLKYFVKADTVVIHDACIDRYPSEMEYTLASVKPLVHKRRKVSENPYDPTWQSYSHDLPKPAQLPPLAHKPQVRDCIKDGMHETHWRDLTNLLLVNVTAPVNFTYPLE